MGVRVAVLPSPDPRRRTCRILFTTPFPLPRRGCGVLQRGATVWVGAGGASESSVGTSTSSQSVLVAATSNGESFKRDSTERLHVDVVESVGDMGTSSSKVLWDASSEVVVATDFLRIRIARRGMWLVVVALLRVFMVRRKGNGTMEEWMQCCEWFGWYTQNTLNGVGPKDILEKTRRNGLAAVQREELGCEGERSISWASDTFHWNDGYHSTRYFIGSWKTDR